MGDPYHSKRDGSVQNIDYAGLRFTEGLHPDRDADINPARYLEGLIARDNLLLYGSEHRPRSRSPRHSNHVNVSHDTSPRNLVHALDEYYRFELKVEPGHRFDNVDDTVIAAYINARDYGTQDMQRITGQEQQWSMHNSWTVDVPFLRLPHTVLEFQLPIAQDVIKGVTNDILRVLYVRLSNNFGIPTTVSDLSVVESRRRTLSELERRGFTAQLPHVARFQGLNTRLAHRKSMVPAVSHDPSSSSKPPNRPSASADRPGRKVKTEAAYTRPDVEMSDKWKGKAPVTRDQASDSSSITHLSTATPSSTVRTEHGDSSSEDTTAEHAAGPGRPSKNKMGIFDRKADY